MVLWLWEGWIGCGSKHSILLYDGYEVDQYVIIDIVSDMTSYTGLDRIDHQIQSILLRQYGGWIHNYTKQHTI